MPCRIHTIFPRKAAVPDYDCINCPALPCAIAPRMERRPPSLRLEEASRSSPPHVDSTNRQRFNIVSSPRMDPRHSSRSCDKIGATGLCYPSILKEGRKETALEFSQNITLINTFLVILLLVLLIIITLYNNYLCQRGCFTWHLSVWKTDGWDDLNENFTIHPH